jgi:hypothetical protein
MAQRVSLNLVRRRSASCLWTRFNETGQQPRPLSCLTEGGLVSLNLSDSPVCLTESGPVRLHLGLRGHRSAWRMNAATATGFAMTGHQQPTGRTSCSKRSSTCSTAST